MASSLLNETNNSYWITEPRPSQVVEQMREQTITHIRELLETFDEITVGDISRYLRKVGKSELVGVVSDATETLEANGELTRRDTALITRFTRGGKIWQPLPNRPKTAFVFAPKEAPQVFCGKTEKGTF